MSKYCVFLVLLAACSGYCDELTTCTQEAVCGSYIEIAIDILTKVRNNIPNCGNCIKNRKLKAVDCADVLRNGHNKSGVYEIYPVNRLTEGKRLYVYCDMDTDGGGWTVFQRRGDFGSPEDFFYQVWGSYKVGFGDIKKDFWLGNDNIYTLSNQKAYSVRFDLRDAEKKTAYAHYDTFWIDDEDHKYRIHISDYSGDAGDAMKYHNNQAFSTKDQDNDSHNERHCAVEAKGAWWYNGCRQASLNGLYHKGKQEIDGVGVNWLYFKGNQESLEWTEIKIRPKNFKIKSEVELV